MEPELKDKINKLAGLFYKSEGYEQDMDYDYSKARHPQERGMWNKALIAYCFFDGDFSLLEYQV